MQTTGGTSVFTTDVDHVAAYNQPVCSVSQLGGKSKKRGLECNSCSTVGTLAIAAGMKTIVA